MSRDELDGENQRLRVRVGALEQCIHAYQEAMREQVAALDKLVSELRAQRLALELELAATRERRREDRACRAGVL